MQSPTLKIEPRRGPQTTRLRLGRPSLYCFSDENYCTCADIAKQAVHVGQLQDGGGASAINDVHHFHSPNDIAVLTLI